MIKKKVIKYLPEYFIKIFSTYVLYSSTITIVLFPMLIVSGIFTYVLRFYNISWILADPTLFLENKDIRTIWLNTHLYIPTAYWDLYKFLKFSIFILGLVLFIISLSQLVRGLKEEHTLVTRGIYKHIRHPQNLAIIIMALPLFLYFGIRMGDIVSWLQFSFLMFIYSDLGDMRLKKKYPEQFQSYYQNTGFMTLKLLPYRITRWFSAITNKKFRYLLFLACYILTIVILYQLYLILPFYILHY